MNDVSQACLSEGVVVTPEVVLISHPQTLHNPLTYHDYNLTTFLLLESLAESAHAGEVSDKSSAALTAIDNKLDLLLQLVTQLLSQQQAAGAVQQVRLSAQGIEWQTTEAPSSESVLEIFLEPQLSRSIKLPVNNRILERETGAVRICSHFHNLDDSLQGHLEKWVFRCHRREIALQRHGRNPDA